MPDLACKLPPSRESLIRALATVSSKSILYITNIGQLEMLTEADEEGMTASHSQQQRCSQALALF